ncbi:MAG TPA: paraquat-inducible protein A [Chitinophagaceae bacterium]|nr:paraquat-inducible protein A [Chitinophagaceae bacterium]
MNKNNDRKQVAMLILVVSFLFFIMGFMFPLLQTGYGIGPVTLKSDYVYLHSSFRFFFDKGEVFIGFLLLFFTIIFPVIKYIFLFITLSGKKLPHHKFLSTALEIVNKWAMLDVFIVAVLLLNMKFDSDIIISKLESGTTLFAISIVLMMIASFVIGNLLKEKPIP